MSRAKSLSRKIEKKLVEDLKSKIVIVAGPRQCGKTTLSKGLKESIDYLNFDIIDDRDMIINRKWDRKKKLIVFDELHKMPKWKAWLKGIYDKEGVNPAILVTGSARLNAFKKTGDSLAGRHYYYRLHPFDSKELKFSKYEMDEELILDRLLMVGGYPEPFLKGSESEYRRWRQGHLDVILRQDLADFELIKEIKSIELLVHLLRSRVGSGVSANSLATDLQKDPKTIQRWLEILEDLFVIFKLTPYSKDIARAVKKEPKYYFYDTGLVDGDLGQKLENQVACSLLKECHYQSDVMGEEYRLHFLKIKGGREIDFVIIPENKKKSPLMIETKLGDSSVSPNFKLFESSFKACRKVQLVKNLDREFVSEQGVEVRRASQWLANFEL